MARLDTFAFPPPEDPLKPKTRYQEETVTGKRKAEGRASLWKAGGRCERPARAVGEMDASPCRPQRRGGSVPRGRRAGRRGTQSGRPSPSGSAGPH